MKIEKKVEDYKNTGSFSRYGLIGFYFKGIQFNDLLLITQKKDSNLSLDKTQVSSISNIQNEKIQSARWLGFIRPEQTDAYVFSTPSNHEMLIQIDNQIINMGRKITLEKDKIYPIRIESRFEKDINHTVTCELFWTYSDKKEIISEVCLLSPDFKNTEFHPQTSLFGDVADDNTDSDQDGLIDDWETNGYTIDDNGNVVPWSTDYEGMYTKYVSNPKQASTVGDPYTDLEKVTGSMDRATTLEARNPLVAAYPKVGVSMEKLIISENEDLTNSQENSTSSSKTESNTANTSAEAGADGKKFVGKINAGFSHTSSTTQTTEENDTKQVHINTGQSAYLNANIRYFNTGTAPIYQVTPTNNFIIDDETIVTITAPSSNIGNSLSPGATYPDQSLHAMALTEIEPGKDFTIHYDSLEKLQSGEQLLIETTQISGTVDDNNTSWEKYFTQIVASSACLILDTGVEVLERRVAAKNYNDSLDYTPEITFRDAIQVAFLATNDGDILSYKGIPICEELVQLIYDQQTGDDFEKQLEQDPSKTMFDLLLKQGMNILIKIPCVSYDCNGSASVTTNGITWNGTTNQDSIGKEGGCLKGTNATGTLTPCLDPYGKYVLSIYAKAINDNTSIDMGIMDKNSNNKRHSTSPLDTDWQRIDFEFKVLDDTSIADRIFVNSNNGDIYFDDITVTKLETLTSNITEQVIQQAHTIDHWETNTGAGQVSAVYLKLDPEYVCDYEVVVDGKSYGTGTRYGTDENGIQKINFTEYNAGYTFDIGSRVQINAIYMNDPTVKTIVALWYNQQNIDIQGWERLVMNATINFYSLKDSGGHPESYGYIKFYSDFALNQEANEVPLWSIPSRDDYTTETTVSVNNLEFYAPNGTFVFYGDVKDHDTGNAGPDDILAHPDQKVSANSGDTVTLSGTDATNDYVTINFTITYP
ncbi:binary toxin-like calcium binding domain-containing protein [Bacillus thuringiensis]|uniref:binary toxin-like calcium binding domain-containing protein n=1 Tax=Bacillus thuringiensis TaxID=1428 RepID=UPI00164305B3|nr:binary toxin-like calcium binding domain-containing protein [Bacillus thuringiensis]